MVLVTIITQDGIANDGILNSIESLGDVSFDISDLNNPILSNNGSALSISMNPNINSQIIKQQTLL